MAVMARVYGKPFDRGAQINRWFRRSTSGLLMGRSESVAEVVLGRGRRGIGRPGAPGGPGLPGPDGTARITRPGGKWFARVFPGSLSNTTLSSFGGGADGNTAGGGQTWSAGGVLLGNPIVCPATNDIDGVPRWLRGTGTGNNSSATFLLAHPANLAQYWVPGRGNGEAGFFTVLDFAIPVLNATGKWFVGLVKDTLTSFAVGPAVADVPCGVWQDTGDGSPSFLYLDGAAALHKVATGIPSLVGNRQCRVTLFSDPEGTGSVQISIEVRSLGVTTAIASFDTGADIAYAGRWTPIFWCSNGTPAASQTAQMCFLGFFHQINPII